MSSTDFFATPSPPQPQPHPQPQLRPPPELCALVAGIISTFSTSSALFASWRAKRREKNLPEKPQTTAEYERLEVLLNTSGRVVQAEYDRDFRYFGSRFSVGDEPTRYILCSILHALQTHLNHSLQTALHHNILDIPIAPLLSCATSARTAALAALAAQYNRLAATKLLDSKLLDTVNTSLNTMAHPRRPPNPTNRTNPSFNPSHTYCSIALLLQQTSGPMPLRFLMGLPCAICGTVLPSAPFVIEKPTGGGRETGVTVSPRFLAKCHVAGRGAGFGCVICERVEEGMGSMGMGREGRGEVRIWDTLEGFVEHVGAHGFGELGAEGDIG